jgi:hypothetical protein
MAASARPLEVFDLSVLGAGDHLWLSASSSQGSVYGIPRSLPTWALTDGVQTPSDWLTRVVLGADPRAEDTARTIGRTLSDLVFGVRDVLSLFQQARGAAGRAGAQLLVRILAAPDEIAAIPWEVMLDPQTEGDFLTMARDVHVVRGGRSRTYPVRSEPIEPPLNMLIVLSNPLTSEDGGQADTAFDLYQERRALLEELSPLEDRGLLSIAIEDRPTVESIRARIAARAGGFHLLHYVGHAQPSGLRLEYANGRGRLVESGGFTALLQQMPDLRLAVFAGCETARAPGEPGTDAWPGPLSIADHCVRDACPLVIGMQAVLPFGTNRLFTRFFYSALIAGHPVAEALRLSRLAIAGNTYSGGTLVNWSVPALFVGGILPGPVIDPAAKAVPRPRPQRLVLRTDIRQREGRFTSRLTEMREAIDVLCGRKSATMLQIFGQSGTGKSAFLDRLVEELDRDVLVLAFSGTGFLADESGARLANDAAGADAAIAALCRRVSELLKRCGHRPTPPGRRKPPELWRLLLEDLSGVRIALVIDDAQDLADGSVPGAAVLRALHELTQRRGGIRLAFAVHDELPALTADAPLGRIFKIELKALSWTEVWEWIFRNLPGLTRLGADALAPFYYDLTHLEQWEQLALLVEDRGLATPQDLTGMVREVLRHESRKPQVVPVGRRPPVVDSGVPVFGVPRAPDADVDRTRRPVRVAVAGQHTVGRDTQFSRALTRFAADHGVSGRVASSPEDSAAALAVLVSPPTPFDVATGSATVVAIKDWLDKARAQAADIVVLDFGDSEPHPEIEAAAGAMRAEGRLVIAAGGNSGAPSYPAWHESVLAVGAAEEDRPSTYSPWFEAAGKPDLYAPHRLDPDGLGSILADPTIEGTSISALHAAAAALVVWASDLAQTGYDVRRVLVETAHQVEVGTSTIRIIDVEGSLAAVRRQLLIDNLQTEPLELGQILATTGLRPEIAVPLLDKLIDEGVLVRALVGESELIEDPQSLAQQYALLRTTPYGPGRTRGMQQLVGRARALSRRGRFARSKLQGMWDSGHEGRRIVALAAVVERPELGSVDIVADAIEHPRSSFEQFQALNAAQAMWERLNDSERIRLKAVVKRAQPGAPRGRRGADRSRTTLASRLLDA